MMSERLSARCVSSRRVRLLQGQYAQTMCICVLLFHLSWVFLILRDIWRASLHWWFTISIRKWKANDRELKHRLNEFKDTLISEHGLQKIEQSKWERKRDKFINTVREIAKKPESVKLICNQLHFLLKHQQKSKFVWIIFFHPLGEWIFTDSASIFSNISRKTGTYEIWVSRIQEKK